MCLNTEKIRCYRTFSTPFHLLHYFHCKQSIRLFQTIVVIYETHVDFFCVIFILHDNGFLEIVVKGHLHIFLFEII
jgi:hypothetical protein